jgi:hypothetical protein
MRENESEEDLITPNEEINTELGPPYEMRNRAKETGIEPENDRAEPVGHLVVTNLGAESFQVPPILDIEVLIERTESFRVPPERWYDPGSKSSKRLRPRVSGNSPPKRKRKGARGTEDQSAEKKPEDQEVDRYFPNLRPDVLRVKGRRTQDKVPMRVNSVRARWSMQRKADAVVIDKAKSINRKWREVKLWGKSVTGRLANEDRPHRFPVPDEEVGVNMADFRRMRNGIPFTFSLGSIG